MSIRDIGNIDVQFALSESESSDLSARRCADGSFDVVARYQKTSGITFPSRETIERSGSVPGHVVSEFVRCIRQVASRRWYHHYRGKGARRPGGDDCWWSIRLESRDAHIERWEGVNNAPNTIDDAYQQLLAFGMPRLRLGFYGDFKNACGTWPTDESSLVPLLCYRQLLDEAMARAAPDEVPDEARLVAQEYCADIRLLLDGQGCVPTEADLQDIWDVERSVDGLLRAPVDAAPRRQMLALFSALAHRPNGPDLILRAWRTKTLARWWKRLEELPDEERAARELARIETQQETQANIDTEIRRLIDEREEFTSYEVGRTCNSSAQQASARIRQFVRNGLLCTVGDDYPRRYRAA